MAWKCSASTNEALIDNLVNANIITKQRVITAMKAINRKDFCPRYAYEDSPQAIGYGATISAPHMHGYALDNLESYLQPGMKALDVGSGSGYLSACMASMVGTAGKVVGIEHIKELVDASTHNVHKSHADWIKQENIKFVHGDGRLGYKEDAPYDCIHVGAAAPTTPETLIDQLNSPGRLFIPVGTDSQWIMIYDKDKNGDVTSRKWLGVSYVPLTDASSQRNGYY